MKVRQHLAVIIDEAEDYLKKASEIKMDKSGRTVGLLCLWIRLRVITVEMGGDDY